MIINRLEMYNFRQYIGHQAVDFSTDPEKNVTVLIGINTSGKTTIAFPSISTGVYGYPKDQAAEIAVRTVNEFVEEHPDAFDFVEWALFDEDTLQTYAYALNQLEVSKLVSGSGLDAINKILRDGLV